MLREGQFVKEALPKIGSHYVPPLNKRNFSPDELLMQDIMLAKRKPNRQSLLDKFRGLMSEVMT